MNKKFRHVVFALLLAFATLLPMASSASAQCFCTGSNTNTNANVVFVNRFNDLVNTFDNSFLLAQASLGTTRVSLLASAMLGIPAAQINIRAASFGIPVATFISTEIIARTVGIPTATIVQAFGPDRTLGDIALQFRVPIGLVAARFSAFTSIFLNDIAVQSGTTTSTNTADIEALLILIFETANARLEILAVRLGDATLDVIVLTRLSVETNTDLQTLLALRSRFRDLSIGTFSSAIIAANILGAAAQLQELGFTLESFDVATPLGAARALAGFGIPVQIAVSRIDTFNRAVKDDAAATTPEP